MNQKSAINFIVSSSSITKAEISHYNGVTDVTAALLSVICTVLIIKCDEKRKAKALTEQNATKHSQANLYTRQMNLLITVFAVSIIMLMVNRSVVGVAYRFQLPTANILIYIGCLSGKAIILLLFLCVSGKQNIKIKLGTSKPNDVNMAT
ncbi:unnamed protein product [Schistosoma rodhaini]|nr:unnamed protein product [Schistosoma rodhaini]